MDLDIFKAIVERREPLALATSIEVKGSSPRHPGARLLFGLASGRRGTVGGGRGEALVLEACRRSLETGQSELLKLEMLGTDATGPDMICGGVHTVLVEPEPDPTPCRLALEHLAAGRPVLLATRFREGSRPAVTLRDRAGLILCGTDDGLDPAEAARLLEAGQPSFRAEDSVFIEPLFPPDQLLVLGGGHVGRALAAAALPLGFRVTVADDRPEVLAEAPLPAGVRTVAAPFEQVIADFPWNPSTYAVVVTRSHRLDLDCVRALLDREYRYAGFMGSTRKSRFILEQLRTEGRDPARVEALWTPIGLDIGAETPEELAIALLGEIIAVRRNAAILPALRNARSARRAAGPRTAGPRSAGPKETESHEAP